MSTAYYAVFHFLARRCADLFVGAGTARRRAAWAHVYRALDHGFAKNACSRVVMFGFPEKVTIFADSFVDLQEERHRADYDPGVRYSRAETETLIENAERAITVFNSVPRRDRLAFAVFVLLRRR